MSDVQFSAQPIDMTRNGTYARTPDAKFPPAEFYRHHNGLDYIHILMPGDKTTDIRVPVTKTFMDRYRTQWLAYKQQLDQFSGQTRLEEVVWINEGARRLLQSLAIFTVEQLAGVSDGDLPNLGMGARNLRERARDYASEKIRLQEARKTEAENKALQGQLAQNAEMMARMMARLEKLEGAPAEPAPAAEPPDVEFAKLSVPERHEAVRAAVASGMTQKEAGEKFGFAQGTVSRILGKP